MSLCILTDTTALIPQPAPHTGKFIFAIHRKSEASGLLPIDLQEYQEIFTRLEHEFNAILVLTGSDALFGGVETAQQAARSHGGSARIEVLDTQQLGSGLGILTLLAAHQAAAGRSLLETQDYVRAASPCLFTILCPDQLFPGQEKNSAAGNFEEPPGVLPIYTVEEGQFALYKKVRTQRHLLEIFQEFLEEFETPEQVCLFHGKNTSLHIRALRNTILELFPGIQLTDLELNENLTHLFGEHTAGLTVLELPRERGQ